MPFAWHALLLLLEPFMSNIVVVYHSGYGHTRRLAEEVAAGAEAKLVAIDAEGNLEESAWAQLDAADAIIFGSPTYMGTVTWQFKKFMDSTSKPWFGQLWKDKLAAGFTISAAMNGDKHGVLQTLMTLAMQHSMLWAGLGLMPSSNKASLRNDINYMGGTMGLMSQAPGDASPDEIPPGEFATARLFGQRIKALAAKLKPDAVG